MADVVTPAVYPQAVHSDPSNMMGGDPTSVKRKALRNLTEVQGPAQFLIVGNTTTGLGDVQTYDKFFLETLQESTSSRVQIQETFDDNVKLGFFGNRPLQCSLTGKLIEGTGKEWLSNFHKFYNDSLNSTSLARAKKIAILSCMQTHLYCYPTALNLSRSSQDSRLGMFTMSLIVTKRWLPEVPDRKTEFNKDYYVVNIKKAIVEKQAILVNADTTKDSYVIATNAIDAYVNLLTRMFNKTTTDPEALDVEIKMIEERYPA